MREEATEGVKMAENGNYKEKDVKRKGKEKKKRENYILKKTKLFRVRRSRV